VILYELLAGKVPGFDAETALGILLSYDRVEDALVRAPARRHRSRPPKRFA
jgi:hypothetical protein